MARWWAWGHNLATQAVRCGHCSGGETGGFAMVSRIRARVCKVLTINACGPRGVNCRNKGGNRSRPAPSSSPTRRCRRRAMKCVPMRSRASVGGVPIRMRTHIRMYSFAHVHTCTHIHLHACVDGCIACVRVYVCACVHVRMYVRVYRRVQRLEVTGHPAIQRPVQPTVGRHLHIHVRIRGVCVCVCVCVCMCVRYVCVCAYTDIQIYRFTSASACARGRFASCMRACMHDVL